MRKLSTNVLSHVGVSALVSVRNSVEVKALSSSSLNPAGIVDHIERLWLGEGQTKQPLSVLPYQILGALDPEDAGTPAGATTWVLGWRWALADNR